MSFNSRTFEESAAKYQETLISGRVDGLVLRQLINSYKEENALVSRLRWLERYAGGSWVYTSSDMYVRPHKVDTSEDGCVSEPFRFLFLKPNPFVEEGRAQLKLTLELTDRALKRAWDKLKDLGVDTAFLGWSPVTR